VWLWQTDRYFSSFCASSTGCKGSQQVWRDAGLERSPTAQWQELEGAIRELTEDSSPELSERAKEGSDQEGFDQSVQSHVLVTAESAERNEAAVRSRRSSEKWALLVRQDGNPSSQG
jgi:hypothetical protein